VDDIIKLGKINLKRKEESERKEEGSVVEKDEKMMNVN
jgi:hypothetical protein